MTQLIILPNGRAKEIHPMGEKPKYNTKRSDSPYLQKHIKKLDKWFDIESSLKEYRITHVTREYEKQITEESFETVKCVVPIEKAILPGVGSVVTCEVNQEEGTATIL